jgi:sec-independent protein translocase protein TatA
MPFGIQPIHLVIVFVVALLVFGPQRLPEIGRGVGKAIVEFKKGTREFTETLREETSGTPSASTSLAVTSAYPAASGNYCTHCGTPNPVDARFCNRCGSAFPGVETVQPGAVESHAESVPLEH